MAIVMLSGSGVYRVVTSQYSFPQRRPMRFSSLTGQPYQRYTCRFTSVHPDARWLDHLLVPLGFLSCGSPVQELPAVGAVPPVREGEADVAVRAMGHLASLFFECALPSLLSSFLPAESEVGSFRISGSCFIYFRFARQGNAL